MRVSSDEAPIAGAPLTRRAHRRASTQPESRTPVGDPAPGIDPEPESTGAPAPRALAWLDPQSVLRSTAAPAGLSTAPQAVAVAPDLLAGAPRRRVFTASVLIPILLVAFVAGGYSAAALTWPLTAIPPTIAAGQVQPAAAAEAAIAWPKAGSAAVAVAGIGGPLESSTSDIHIASITKIVTALLVLDEMPLAVGEQGPKYSFTERDRRIYWEFVAHGESALDVPVGGTLTEYQLLQGMLIGSAGNYAHRLAADLWPTDEVFAAAAKRWLTDHGIEGITISDPTGFGKGNHAEPEALIPLAEKALANPVIAEIVATKSVKLPGAGTVKNGNGLLADAGVLGLKTGTLKVYSLLSAKDVAVDGITVRLYAAVLGQKNDKTRLSVSRDLYAQLEKALVPAPSVTAGTVAGAVTTAWGEKVDVVAAKDAAVVLWNGAAPAATVDVALHGQERKGDAVGTLTLTGPLNSARVDLVLDRAITGPDAWWRLTHPLELFGIGR